MWQAPVMCQKINQSHAMLTQYYILKHYWSWVRNLAGIHCHKESKWILINISVQRYMARIHGLLQNSTRRIQMDSRIWSWISDPAGVTQGAVVLTEYKSVTVHNPICVSPQQIWFAAACAECMDEVPRVFLNTQRDWSLTMLKGTSIRLFT